MMGLGGDVVVVVCGGGGVCVCVCVCVGGGGGVGVGENDFECKRLQEPTFKGAYNYYGYTLNIIINGKGFISPTKQL